MWPAVEGRGDSCTGSVGDVLVPAYGDCGTLLGDSTADAAATPMGGSRGDPSADRGRAGCVADGIITTGGVASLTRRTTRPESPRRRAVGVEYVVDCVDRPRPGCDLPPGCDAGGGVGDGVPGDSTDATTGAGRNTRRRWLNDRPRATLVGGTALAASPPISTLDAARTLRHTGPPRWLCWRAMDMLDEPRRRLRSRREGWWYVGGNPAAWNRCSGWLASTRSRTCGCVCVSCATDR